MQSSSIFAFDDADKFVEKLACTPTHGYRFWRVFLCPFNERQEISRWTWHPIALDATAWRI
jgi:hypothetical protein